MPSPGDIIEIESPRDYIEALQRNNRVLRVALVTARAELDEAYLVVAKAAMARNKALEDLKALEAEHETLKAQYATLEADIKQYRDIMADRLCQLDREL